MSWTHSLDDLNNFINHANMIHSSIKLTSEVSQTEISFLDVKVKRSDTISTSLHTKSTDSHMFLLPTSCHPKHLNILNIFSSEH